MLHIYSFIPEELAPLLCLIGFNVILFHCVFFSSCAKIHSFQFILVISFGSWICMQTYQHLVFFFFSPFPFVSFSIFLPAVLISLLGFRTVQRWMWVQVSLDVINLSCRDGLLGETKKPAYSASLDVFFSPCKSESASLMEGAPFLQDFPQLTPQRVHHASCSLKEVVKILFISFHSLVQWIFFFFFF